MLVLTRSSEYLLCREVNRKLLDDKDEAVQKNQVSSGQGRNEGAKGGTIPRAPNHYRGAESLRGRRMTAGGAEKFQKCHKHFLQYSTFASERPQVRTWGRQTCLLPRAPSNLVTPLGQVTASPIRSVTQNCTNFWITDKFKWTNPLLLSAIYLIVP